MRTFDYAGGKGATLEELRGHLEGRAREYVTAPLSSLAVDGDSGELVYGSLRAGMTPFAASKLAHRLSLPGSFLLRTPTDNAADNFNRFLPAAQGDAQLAVEHVGGSPVVVGVLPPRVSPVPLEQLVDHFEADGRNGLDDGGWRHDDHGLTVRFTSPSLVAQPKVGDLVRAGVDVTDYENDTGLLDVSGALYRLVCSNGAQVRSITFGGRLRKEAWRDPHAVIAAAASYFEEAVKGVGGFVAGLEETPNIPFVLPDEGAARIRAVRRADAVVSVPGSMAESVSEALRGEDPTVFGYYNALTRLGRDARDRTARARFEKAGFGALVARERVAAAVAPVGGDEEEE